MRKKVDAVGSTVAVDVAALDNFFLSEIVNHSRTLLLFLRSSSRSLSLSSSPSLSLSVILALFLWFLVMLFIYAFCLIIFITTKERKVQTLRLNREEEI